MVGYIHDRGPRPSVAALLSKGCPWASSARSATGVGGGDGAARRQRLGQRKYARDVLWPPKHGESPEGVQDNLNHEARQPLSHEASRGEVGTAATWWNKSKAQAEPNCSIRRTPPRLQNGKCRIEARLERASLGSDRIRMRSFCCLDLRIFAGGAGTTAMLVPAPLCAFEHVVPFRELQLLQVWVTRVDRDSGLPRAQESQRMRTHELQKVFCLAMETVYRLSNDRTECAN